MEQNRNPQQDLQNLSVQLDYLEQTAKTLQQRMGMLQAAISNLTFASAALEGMEKEKENAEMLVPIGSSSYVKMKLADPDKVIVGIGAGVSVERTVQETKAIFKERLEQMQKAFVSSQQQFTQVAERINQGRRTLQSYLTGAGEAEGNP